jgi:hypothetical protein
MARRNTLSLLEGGDGRTIGRSHQVVAMVSDHPELFPKLIAGLWSAHLQGDAERRDRVRLVHLGAQS